MFVKQGHVINFKRQTYKEGDQLPKEFEKHLASYKSMVTESKVEDSAAETEIKKLKEENEQLKADIAALRKPKTRTKAAE